MRDALPWPCICRWCCPRFISTHFFDAQNFQRTRGSLWSCHSCPLLCFLFYFLANMKSLLFFPLNILFFFKIYSFFCSQSWGSMFTKELILIQQTILKILSTRKSANFVWTIGFGIIFLSNNFIY